MEEEFHVVLQNDTSQSDPIWIPELNLLQSDRSAIESETTWMNHRIMHACMLLLKRQFPNQTGFGDPLFVAALRTNYKDEKFIQIVFNGNNHWITVTNKSCGDNQVRLYDILNSLPSLSVEQQIAAMCLTNAPEISVQSMNVVRQKGMSDCGMFAVAYITSISMGQDPVNIVYKQETMRPHLLQCLVAKNMSSFPVQCYRTVRKPVSLSTTLKLFCLCRQVYMRGSKMIECTRCREWYHQVCILLSNNSFNDAAENKSFLCVKCSDRDDGVRDGCLP